MSIGAYYASEAIPPSRIVVLLPDNTIALCKSSTIDALGVTRNAAQANANDLVTVSLGGQELVTYGGTVALNDNLTSDAQGRAIKAGPSDKSIGPALQAGGIGTVGRVDLVTGGFGGIDIGKILAAAQQALTSSQDAGNSAAAAQQHEVNAGTASGASTAAATASAASANTSKQWSAAPVGQKVDGQFESSLASAYKANLIATTSQALRSDTLTDSDFPLTLTASDFYRSYHVNATADVQVIIPSGLYTVTDPNSPHDQPWVVFIPVGAGKITFAAAGGGGGTNVPTQIWQNVVASGAAGNPTTTANFPFSVPAPAGNNRRLVMIGGATFTVALAGRNSSLVVSGLTMIKAANDSWAGGNAAPDCAIWTVDLGSSAAAQTYNGSLTLQSSARYYALWGGIYSDCSGYELATTLSDSVLSNGMSTTVTPTQDKSKIVGGFFGFGDNVHPISLTGLTLLSRAQTGSGSQVNGCTYAIGDVDKLVKGNQILTAGYAANCGRARASIVLQPMAAAAGGGGGSVKLVGQGGRLVSTEAGQSITVKFHGDGQTRIVTGT